MSYWSKQAIAREVELEKMRRAKPKVSEDDEEVKEKPVEAEKPDKPQALPNHLQRLIPKAIKNTKPAQVVSGVEGWRVKVD
jgi:chromosome transmission fidelity protein 18